VSPATAETSCTCSRIKRAVYGRLSGVFEGYKRVERWSLFPVRGWVDGLIRSLRFPSSSTSLTRSSGIGGLFLLCVCNQQPQGEGNVVCVFICVSHCRKDSPEEKSVGVRGASGGTQENSNKTLIPGNPSTHNKESRF
jgi:hypothetical protein